MVVEVRRNRSPAGSSLVSKIIKPERIVSASLLLELINPAGLMTFSKSCSEKAAEVAQNLEPKYLEVLEKHGINPKDVSILLISQKTRNVKEFDTLIIKTEDIETSNWKIAATEILLLFTNAGLKKDEIRIEIRNPAKRFHDPDAGICLNPQIWNFVDKVRSKVMQVVRDHLPAWTSVVWSASKCERHLPCRKLESTPTLKMSCPPGTIANFGEIESAIEDVLKAEDDSDLVIHIEMSARIITLY